MYYQYQDFSKADKKILRDILEIAVKNEIAAFVKETLPEHKGLVEQTHEDIRVPYWAFYEKLQDFSKHLQNRYDGHSHTHIPERAAVSIVEGHLSQADIADFSDSGKAKILGMVELLRKRN